MVGVVSPRLVVPADYERRFTREERRIIRAHERTHIERGDPQANALMAALQVACWFNPLVHLAARSARRDQELACDAAVLRRGVVSPRRYAETLLRAQLAPVSLPLGCQWRPASRHPLEVRVAALASPAPAPRRRIAGQVAVAALALAAGTGAWAAKPAVSPPARFKTPAAPAQPVMTFWIYRR